MARAGAPQGPRQAFRDRAAFEGSRSRSGGARSLGSSDPMAPGRPPPCARWGRSLRRPRGPDGTGLELAPENGVEIRRRIAIMPNGPASIPPERGREPRVLRRPLRTGRCRRRIDRPCLRSTSPIGLPTPAGPCPRACASESPWRGRCSADPEVLFLDEPTSGLDPVAAREVHELIAGLVRGSATIFLTTHRLEEAERLCDRVAILNTTLRTIGRPGELRDRLFARTLLVTTLAPLTDPGGVFDALPGVDALAGDGPGRVPASRCPIHRWPRPPPPGRWSPRAPTCSGIAGPSTR